MYNIYDLVPIYKLGNTYLFINQKLVKILTTIRGINQPRVDCVKVDFKSKIIFDPHNVDLYLKFGCYNVVDDYEIYSILEKLRSVFTEKEIEKSIFDQLNEANSSILNFYKFLILDTSEISSDKFDKEANNETKIIPLRYDVYFKQIEETKELIEDFAENLFTDAINLATLGRWQHWQSTVKEGDEIYFSEEMLWDTDDPNIHAVLLLRKENLIYLKRKK